MERDVPQARELQELRAELQHVRLQRDEALAAVGDGRAQQAALRHELAHQIRNRLAVIRSVFSRTAAHASSVEELNSHYVGRLDTIVRFSKADLAHITTFDLETMVWDEMLRFPTGMEDRIRVTGAPERLPFHIAQAVGLALHELATNSVKFGALFGMEGAAITVSWSRDDQDLLIEWVESCPSRVQPAENLSGFGREYLEQALPYQIGAVTSFVVSKDGVHCSIRIPGVSKEVG
jgi:two-component system CheB/CheR fusion protein